jgi:hypothetical protein
VVGPAVHEQPPVVHHEQVHAPVAERAGPHLGPGHDRLDRAIRRDLLDQLVLSH